MLSVDTQTLADLLNFALIIRQYLEQLKSLESSIAAFDSEIVRLMDNFDPYLETISGVGKTLAAVIFSEIGGDIKKFSSVTNLVAYAGLYPKSRQSGESKTDGRMSKRGSPYLRRAVWLSATVAAFKDPAISAFYQKKRSEGKDHLTLGTSVTKCLPLAALRDNEPYVPASTS